MSVIYASADSMAIMNFGTGGARGLAESPRRPRREAPKTPEARGGARPRLNSRGANLGPIQEAVCSTVLKVLALDKLFCPAGAGSTPASGFQFS